MCPPLFVALGSIFGGGAAAGTAAATAGTAAAAGSGFTTAMQLAGLGLSTIGTVQSARAQAAGMEAQARLNERQSLIEQQSGAFEAQRERENAERIMARQRAGYLASGVALEGSPTAVIEDTATEAAMDIAAIKWGSNLRASNYQAQAGVDRMNASATRTAGTIGAFGSFASGLARTRLSSPYSVR